MTYLSSKGCDLLSCSLLLEKSVNIFLYLSLQMIRIRFILLPRYFWITLDCMAWRIKSYQIKCATQVTNDDFLRLSYFAQAWKLWSITTIVLWIFFLFFLYTVHLSFDFWMVKRPTLCIDFMWFTFYAKSDLCTKMVISYKVIYYECTSCQLLIFSHHFCLGLLLHPPKSDDWKWATDKRCIHNKWLHTFVKFMNSPKNSLNAMLQNGKHT